MLAEQRYDTLQKTLCWTSDPDTYQSFARDCIAMFAIWRSLEFDGDLGLCPILVTDDTMGLSANGSMLGSFTTYADGTVCIHIDTTACIMEAFMTSRTLYKVVAEAMLHEMVHAWCHEHGIEDGGVDGVHLPAFRDAARAHGLTCRKGCEGYSRTRIKAGHWAPFMEAAQGLRSYSTWDGWDSEWSPTLAQMVRTTHVAEDVAWALLAA